MYKRQEGTNEEAKKAGEYGTPSLDSTFIAYYGVSVKWGKPPVIGAYPEGKDSRAKTWQHSSPLFWGCLLYTSFLPNALFTALSSVSSSAPLFMLIFLTGVSGLSTGST